MPVKKVKKVKVLKDPKVPKGTKKKTKKVATLAAKLVPAKVEPNFKKAQKDILKFVDNKNPGEVNQGVFEISKKYNVPKKFLNDILNAHAQEVKRKEAAEKKELEDAEREAKRQAKEEKAQEKSAEKEADKILRESRLKELEDTWNECPMELFVQVFKDAPNISMRCFAQRVMSDNEHLTEDGETIQGFKTFRDNKEIIRYNKDTGIYDQDADIHIAEKIQWCLGEMAVDYVVREITNKIRRSTYVDRDILLEQPKQLKPIKNGLFNFETKKLQSFNPKYIYLSKINIDYKPEAKYDKFLEFLNEVLETEDEVQAMQEWFGNCLLNDNRFQRACLLFGSGANGKSVLLKIIKKFLGPENVVSIALQYLETNSFALARLFGKSGNIFFDLPKKALSQTSNFKMVVAGDSVTAEKKGKDSFEFTPFCKQMFSCNEVPQTPDTSLAFFRRWLPFKFEQTFEEGNPARVENLEEEFYVKEEMEGILLFALEGLYRLLKNKRFTEYMTHAEIEEFWIKHSDSVLSFIMDMVENDIQSETPKQEFFDKYEEYCKQHEYVVEDYKVFFKKLKDKIEYEETRPKAEFGVSRQRMIKGIKIKEVIKTITVSS